MLISRSNASIISNESVFYVLRQADNTGILLRFTSKNFTESSTLPQILPDDVPNNTLLYSKEIKLFIPGCELCTCFIYDMVFAYVHACKNSWLIVYELI